MKSDMYQFVALRNELRRHGLDLATQDIHPPQQSTLVLSLDQVDFFQQYERQSAACRAFAGENFTREAYSRSIRSLLARVAEVRVSR